ncbi:MAG: sigma 54-interacting transcriptional regulator [Pseudomonadota bacterium]
MPIIEGYAKLSPQVLQHFDISPFFDMLLKMPQQRTIEGLLQFSTGVYRGTHVPLAALWLLDEDREDHEDQGQSPTTEKTQQPDDAEQKHNSQSKPRTLRLRQTAGRHKQSPYEWTHAQGTFATLPYTEPFVEPILGIVAATQSSVTVAEPKLWQRPDWAIREGYEAYAAFPLLYKGKLFGVLAIFYDCTMTGPLAPLFSLHHKLHTIYADTFAAAVVNAHAFEEVDRLRARLEAENETLRQQVERRQAALTPFIVGDSAALRRVLEQVDMVAPTDATVLIQGESGTGKELMAEAIHRRSQRAKQPLVRVNCSAIPRELFESEFFGHAKGAFTGALRERIGRFQMAHGGTLFLDEVGEIPLELQGKLLRVLQEGTFERVGEDKSRAVDVRIIAASNRDLFTEAERGTFRHDLFYRLSVFPIHLPALRQRPEDIPLLAQHFIERASLRFKIPAPRLTASALTYLQHHEWLGNVRELENAIERAVIMASDGELGPLSTTPRATEMGDTTAVHSTHLQSMPENPYSTLLQTNSPSQALDSHKIIEEKQWLELQRQNIVRALEASQGRVHGKGGAAEKLGIPSTTLRSRMAKLGITS